jgi:hypothetical protein
LYLLPCTFPAIIRGIRHPANLGDASRASW